MRTATLKLRYCDKCSRVFNRVIVQGSVFVTRPGSPTRLFQLAALMLNNVTAGGKPVAQRTGYSHRSCKLDDPISLQTSSPIPWSHVAHYEPSFLL